ncbi:hypothetical protein PHYSODRAFT_307032 [Phytophthora sojae]|uniref:Uncharacterized protein n=1 Tax=Phytophthora sojae (strain P6497) TaxID=1094619 RepID=G5AC96_PHYSP|nr:hypothetical protein PHYSODRAFT_307032 [Phytophthora sojae]EGZ06970.1 hypothetical protein PHYSODRAFT_307032 [Phytophthora sojae]|eukprot:XP_009537734.1 hypothetical protein PHYSODRAFT_307032 [Phytophthora sojae]
MSTCPQCYTGTCKRHRGQDHGRSMVKSANAESTLQKMYEQLVGSKLQKLQAEAERDPSKQHTRDFRKQLDASRDKSMKKSHKSRSKLAKADVTGSGLNPQALAAIYGADSDDSDQEDEERRKRRKKKHKHSSSSSRKRKHRSSDSESDSDSDSSGYSSDDSRRRHKRSSRKHSHHKKSHKKKHKRSRTDSE